MTYIMKEGKTEKQELKNEKSNTSQFRYNVNILECFMHHFFYSYLWIRLCEQFYSLIYFFKNNCFTFYFKLFVTLL